jgi:hypothetical protein
MRTPILLRDYGPNLLRTVSLFRRLFAKMAYRLKGLKQLVGTTGIEPVTPTMSR